MSIGPYTTSNENIAYPFLPGSAIAYKDGGIAGLAAAGKMASWLLVDALVEVDGDVEAAYISSIATLTLTLKTDTGKVYTGTLPYVGVVAYVRWYQVPLYENGLLTLNNLYLLPGSGYLPYLGTIVGSTATFTGTSVSFDPSVVVNPTPAVLSLEADSTVLAPSDGIVKLMAGYNIGLDLQPPAGPPPAGEGIISAFEAPETAIVVSATPGLGEGRIPCTEPVADNSVVRRLGGATADKAGNVSIEADDCYRIEPSLLDPHALRLSGDCVACCSCEDYYSVLERLRTQFRSGGQLMAVGFDDEFNTTAGTLFSPVTILGNAAVRYMRDGSSSYTLQYQVRTLDGHSYGRWEYCKDATIAYFSTATTNDALPLGVLWYSSSMPDDIYYDATKKADQLVVMYSQLEERYRLSQDDGQKLKELMRQANEEIERDKYVALIKNSPKQLQAALLAVLGDDADLPKRPEAGEIAGQGGKADARHRHPGYVARETREDAAHLGMVEAEQFRLGRGCGGACGQRVATHLRFAGPLDTDRVELGLVLAAKSVQVVFRHPLHPVGQRVIEGLPGLLRGQGATVGKHGVPPVGVAGAGLDGFGHLFNGLRNAVGVE